MARSQLAATCVALALFLATSASFPSASAELIETAQGVMMDTSKLPVVNISNTVPLLYALPSLNQSRLGGIMPTFNHLNPWWLAAWVPVLAPLNYTAMPDWVPLWYIFYQGGLTRAQVTPWVPLLINGLDPKKAQPLIPEVLKLDPKLVEKWIPLAYKLDAKAVAPLVPIANALPPKAWAALAKLLDGVTPSQAAALVRLVQHFGPAFDKIASFLGAFGGK